MNKEELIKLTEALGQLGYKIKRFDYIVRTNEITTKYSPAYYETEREIELTLSLPLIKSDTRT